jgi:hypothetical protein
MPPRFCPEEEAVKTITLRIFGYESEPVAVSITPEDTALAILSQAGLDGCSLVRKSAPHRHYHNSEAPYAELTDGEALYAVLPGGD